LRPAPSNGNPTMQRPAIQRAALKSGGKTGEAWLHKNGDLRFRRSPACFCRADRI
jgi:hypothetical protein